jgi:hypothetical protein
MIQPDRAQRLTKADEAVERDQRRVRSIRIVRGIRDRPERIKSVEQVRRAGVPEHPADCFQIAGNQRLVDPRVVLLEEVQPDRRAVPREARCRAAVRRHDPLDKLAVVGARTARHFRQGAETAPATTEQKGHLLGDRPTRVPLPPPKEQPVRPLNHMPDGPLHKACRTLAASEQRPTVDENLSRLRRHLFADDMGWLHDHIVAHFTRT